IHLPALQALDDPQRVARATETGEHLDTHRIVGQPLAEGASVLLGEDRGGREHCHLLPRLRRLEGRPQRDLGLAVSYVADQQPVHRSGALHVTLHLLGGATLVGGILVQESRFETALPRGVGCETHSGPAHAPTSLSDALADPTTLHSAT